MDALAALGWLICATVAGAASHVEAPARLVAQHHNPAKMRTVLWHYCRVTAICHTVCHLIQSCWRQPWPWDGWSPAASRHRGQQRAREGNVGVETRFCAKVLKTSLYSTTPRIRPYNSDLKKIRSKVRWCYETRLPCTLYKSVSKWRSKLWDDS